MKPIDFEPREYLEQEYLKIYDKYNEFWKSKNNKTTDLTPIDVLWWASWLNYCLLSHNSSLFKEYLKVAVMEFERCKTINVYEDIYKWVLRGALRWALLELFKEMWEKLPKEVQSLKQFDDMYQRYRVLEDAQEHNLAVFPVTIRIEDRWTKKPHLDFPIEIKSWNPGRIDCIEDGKVYTIIGKMENEKVKYGHVVFDQDAFNLRIIGDVKDGVLFEIAFDKDENYLIKFYANLLSEEEAMHHYPVVGID